MNSLPAAYAAFRKQFDPVLRAAVHEQTTALAKISRDPLLRQLIKQLRQLLLADGKRSRPYAADLMYRTCGGETGVINGPLLALELFHEFALIHDDVMDHGVLRHGVTTLHVFTEKILRQEKWSGDQKRTGASLAILFGDLVLAWADELFGKDAKVDQEKINQARAYYSKMINDVMVGQMLDVSSMSRIKTNKKEVYEKMRLKTASYTFVRPLQIGAVLAGAELDAVEWADKFGTELGLAFQIQDDLLDITATPKELGKTVLSDLKEGQHTIFTQFVFEHSQAKDRAQLARWFGQPVPAKEIRRVRELFWQTGAIAAGQQAMEKHFNAAQRLLADFPMSGVHREEFAALIRFIRQRTK